MKIISLMARKGGVGRTTIATNLAVAFMESGLRVGLIDLDPLCSVTAWGEIRESEEPIVADAPMKNLGKFLEAGRRLKLDIMLLDTPSSGGIDVHEAVLLSNFVLIPCRAGYFDIRAIKLTTDIAKLVGKPYAVMFNAVSPRDDQVVIAVRDELRAAGDRVLDAIVHQRTVLSASVALGSSAIEQDPAGKAAEEIRSLRDELVILAKIQAGKHSHKYKVKAA
ncbi:ParA family protein [Methylobacterium isbiliense]|uniref:AAA family ATPase n=1 Tax=Methylobacterium isbiliense TaxID=315478 RepID=UPI0029E3E9F5|nr:ParA family protein [Methylobacterium isbiliense]